MRFIANASTTLAGALVAVLLAMLVSHLLGRGLHLWVAACLAVGCALGTGIKAQWHLSRGSGAVLVGVLAGVGYVVGTLLSVHA
jgi:hypothetical protein